MNWGWIVIAVTWAVGGFFAARGPNPDLSSLDIRRCYAYHAQVYCWPKRGVFMNGDAALAWQVVKVKPR